jgi:hypothetical protein
MPVPFRLLAMTCSAQANLVVKYDLGIRPALDACKVVNVLTRAHHDCVNIAGYIAFHYATDDNNLVGPPRIAWCLQKAVQRVNRIEPQTRQIDDLLAFTAAHLRDQATADAISCSTYLHLMGID